MTSTRTSAPRDGRMRRQTHRRRWVSLATLASFAIVWLTPPAVLAREHGCTPTTMSGLGTLQTAATLGTTALVGAPAFAAPDSEFEGALGAGTYAFPKAGFGRRVVFHQTATALGFWGRYGYEVFSVGLLHDGPCLPFAFDGLAPAFAMSFVDETDARLYVSAGPQFGLFSARFPAGGAQVSVVHERELGWRTDLETRIGYRAILFDMRAAPLRSQFHALRSDLQVDFAGRGGVRPFALVEVLAVLVGGEGQIYGSGQFGVEARW